MSKIEENKNDKCPDKKIVFLLVILTITFVCFSPTLNNKLLNWDDGVHLTENPSVRFFDIKNIFTSDINSTYIPLTILSFAIEHCFFGYNPFVYHLNNLFLHLAVTGLVFLFALRLGVKIWAATFTALLFGIHPMHVESVAWVTERKDVLYAFFYMMALCGYLRYLEKKKVGSYVLTIVFGVLSVLAKPMALSLPLIMFVCDWVKGRKFERAVLLEKIPHFLYVIPIAWLTYRLHARIPGDSFVEGSLIWIWTLTFYIWKFLFPVILIPLYSLPKPVSIFNFHYVFAISILFLVLICFVRYRRNRWLIFAGLFYFLSIFFLLQYDTFGTQIVADRFMYLPSVGVCILLGVLWERILGNLNKRGIIFRNAGYSCLIVLFLALCIKTYFQNKVWKDDVVLWAFVIQHSDGEALAYVNRGVAYRKDHAKYDLAKADFNKAIAIDPNYALAYINRGAVHTKEGEYGLALGDYKEALELLTDDDSSKVKVYRNRALIYLKQKKYNLAMDDYNSALNINPNFAEAYNARGMLYAIRGDNNLALADFDKAIVINPKFFEAYNNRGSICRKLGFYDLALANFNKALGINPHCMTANNNRTRVYAILSTHEKDKRIQKK